MRTGNPILRADAFRLPEDWSNLAASKPRTMTVMGTVHASIVLLGITGAAAIASWAVIDASPGLLFPVAFGGAILAFILAIVLHMAPSRAPYLAWAYAVLEGAFLGGISLVVARSVGAGGVGIVLQALMLTFGVFGSLLLAYRAGLIRLGGTASRMVVAATGGLCFLYIGVMVMRLVGFDAPLLHELFGFGRAGAIGIGFSVLVIVLAAFNLVLDFQFIEEASASGAPKHMEWYAAFGLLVTLVWLYVEALRLLAKLRRE